MFGSCRTAVGAVATEPDEVHRGRGDGAGDRAAHGIPHEAHARTVKGGGCYRRRDGGHSARCRSDVQLPQPVGVATPVP